MTSTVVQANAIADAKASAMTTEGAKVQNKKAGHATAGSYRHTYPVHTKTAPSPLSKEAPPESYRGFVNLGMLLLFGNNIRLIIENYLKYGFLLSFPGSNVSQRDWILTAITHAVLPFNVIVAYKLEAWAMKQATGFKKRRADEASNGSSPSPAAAAGDDQKKRGKGAKDQSVEAIAKANQSTVGWLHVLNLSIILGWPSFMAYFLIYHPFLAMSCLMNGLVLFLKMTSFALVNQDLRAAFIFDTPAEKLQHATAVHDVSSAVKDSPEPAAAHPTVYQYDVHYPDNITAKNIAYFWFAPTLCYQPSYPRTTVFRKSFFLKRCAEIVTCLGMMYFLIEQYATPTLQNSVRALDDLAFGTILERVLKLSTTSVIIWLLMFYTFFHSFLNALAEVLYFGDRCFYLAWWNSSRLSEYWRLWNKPVYTFFKRHVYLPMVTSGTKPVVASFIIFTISAILHEVLIGIPTHMIYGYAFAGMFFQIPLIALTEPLGHWRGRGSGLGNMIFWVSFTILGQPACAVLYYYHWTKQRMNA
ncbi:MAG: MBOAT, membrane-bound O-acyltransferase family-domain-containing protein [Benniella sp.]|nr:MAG: MBOAT, membrane-bound O-acyltransferase family-domain-containing protein [Benniella sp.]